MKKFIAFTLAEVLITLGVIGVVAAMTMPTLIQNHRKHEVVTKLKKVYSTVNQAIKLSEVEYGSVYDWAGTKHELTNVDDSVEWFNKYIGKHLEIIKIQKDYENNCFYVYLKDGSILRFSYYISDSTYYINQKAVDNPKGGINTFNFRWNPVLNETQKSNNSYKYDGVATFEPYAYAWDGTRDFLINRNGDNFACKTGGAYCAKLIQFDGWQIKDDYPLRF